MVPKSLNSRLWKYSQVMSGFGNRGGLMLARRDRYYGQGIRDVAPLCIYIGTSTKVAWYWELNLF